MTNKKSNTKSHTSYSSFSSITPKSSVQKELFVENKSDKVKASYKETLNGKEKINKNYRTQKSLEKLSLTNK
jgi:hypothetical protein